MKIKVLVVKSHEKPIVKEIENDLKSMQEVVGGLIEEIMPYEDEVALICNEEGKMYGMPLNRAIYDEDGSILDIIAGTFFVCYAPIESENFLGLSDDLLEKYYKLFETPEHFISIDGQIIAVPID